MSAINSVQQIVATIRSEMAARVGNADPRTNPQAQRPASTKGAALAQQQQMGKLINQRVKSLDPDDPKRGKKAFRIFLESVLLKEFGENLINDHAFYQMIDAVQHTMEQDPQILAAIERAISSLLNGQDKQR